MAEKTIDHKSRAHALLSASSAHRWLACPASAVAGEAYPQTATAYTQEGTTAHEVAEIVARERQQGRSPDLYSYNGWPEGTTKEMVNHAHGYADYIEELKKDNNAAVLFEQRVDFSAWVPEGFGTCDCIILQDKTLTVIDYKYGAGVPVSAEANPQLRLYGLGAFNDYSTAFDIEKVEMHIYQPRLNNISDDSITVEELLTWANGTVAPIAQKAVKGKGGYCAGEQCRWCPHAGRCRTLSKACTEYVETHSLRVGVPVLAPHEIANVLEMEPLITLWLKKVKAQALDTLLDGGEVPGYKAVEGRGTRTWADDMRVIEVLRDNGYTAEDYLKTELHSPAGLEAQIGKKQVAELLGGVIVKKPGSPTVAKETDRREPINRRDEIMKDFN